MFFLENLQLALEGIYANKMRSLLTMLGIIIGVAAVIGIVTVGSAVTEVVTGEMQDLGARNIQVSVTARDADFLSAFSGAATLPAARDLITDSMIAQFHQAYYDYIEAITLISRAGSGMVAFEENLASVSFVGINLGYAISNNLNIVAGRFFSEHDMQENHPYVIISDEVASQLFPNGDAVGQVLTIGLGQFVPEFVIIGVYEQRATLALPEIIAGSNQRTNFYFPIGQTSAFRFGTTSGHNGFVVTTVEGVDGEVFAHHVVRYLNFFYEANPSFWVTASPMSMILNITETIIYSISIAVAIIAGISLIVGGVGVMNIQLVSVTERTREIGTRMALGARTSYIRMQFVTEAMILCGIGGIIGVLFGTVIGYFGSLLLGVPNLPNPFVALLAVVFSMLIGLFFGYYPASKAAKLDPIVALRHE